MLTNYHTHTTRCGHAEGTEEEYILTALRCGFKVLGFSDHTPWAYATPGFVSRIRMLPFQLDDYVLTCAGCGRNMPTNSTSASASRQSHFPAYLGWLREETERLDIEYLILGCHYDTTDEQDARASRFGGSPSTAHGRRYAEQVVEALETGLYRYLAHPDLFFEPGDGLRRRRRESLPGHLCRSGAAGHPPRVQHGRTDLQASRRLSGLHPDEFWRIAAESPRQGHHGCDATPPRSWTSSPPSRKRKPSCTAWASRCWTPCRGWNKGPLRGQAASAILKQEE